MKKTKATNKIRAQQSAAAYLSGFLDYLSQKPNITVDKGDDYLLKFPDVCSSYLSSVKENKTACPEKQTLSKKNESQFT